jgi:leucyl aminopeptidase
LDKLNADVLRQAGAAILRTARKARLTRLAVIVPSWKNLSADQAAAALTSGLLLAAFRFEQFKGSASGKDRNDNNDAPMRVTLVAPGSAPIRRAVDRARIIADAQNIARTIASRPGNDVNPPKLAEIARELAGRLRLRCRVLDEKQMRRLGMGGILAVGSASAHPPRMIALEYTPRRAAGGGRARTLLVVGKSITFDAGGISIKPAEKMDRMVFDKSGGCVVLGLLYAAAKLKLPVRLVGILSAAENTLSGRAYRPGDLLRLYNGVSVEVTNTDAEGRLVLGDALAWGIKTFKPDAVVDLATLTGGMIIALGRTTAGFMSNNDDLAAAIVSAARRAGEKVWRMPLYEEHREQIKSLPADIVNSAGREASPIQGGAFLSYFVPEKLPWVHLDIAGTADTDKELPYYARGATAWGLRTMVEWVEERGR